MVIEEGSGLILFNYYFLRQVNVGAFIKQAYKIDT